MASLYGLDYGCAIVLEDSDLLGLAAGTVRLQLQDPRLCFSPVTRGLLLTFLAI